LPLDVLTAFALENYGLEGRWNRLEGERDQNFRIAQDDGVSFVFKVCHPEEGNSVLSCQALALEHIAAVNPSVPVPRLIRSRGGEILPLLNYGGQIYPVMVLSWLPGEVVGKSMLDWAAFRDLGAKLARLGLAMRGFTHGAPAGRGLVWDTRQVLQLAPYVSDLPAADQGIMEDILDRHRSSVAPALQGMRSQIIHGDVHPFNSLLGENGLVSGIIDFGDLVHGPLVLDLANAAADFLSPDGDPLQTIYELTRGYSSVTPLEETEADALLDLIEVRLAMTPLIDALKARNGIASQGYLSDFNGRSLPMIRELRSVGRDKLRDTIRRAATYPPAGRRHPATPEEAIARRRKVMGDKLYVFYDPPLHIVRGEGVWLTSSEGRRYLDCYNNVPHVGHCHPYVSEAISRQARTLNTNTRYVTDQSLEYAERLAALSSDGLNAVVFVNSGSEANDLAWRMAKAWTGKQGGLAMEFAYHGITEAIDAFSPSNTPVSWYAPHIRLLPAPDTYRGMYGPDEKDPGGRYAALAEPLIADLEAEGFGVAAVMIDSAFMTNGILDAPPGYLQGVVDRVRAAGGSFIADEVQSGFGRMGTAFWGHRHHGVIPDFITIGKPAGNGHPLGAVITRPEILSHFLKPGPFFSTFGGNNVACAAGIAVLDVIHDEGLVENSRITGEYFRGLLRQLMAKHEVIGDVRGVGLATGVELVLDRKSKTPAGELVPQLLNRLRDQSVLMGGEGKFGNVLKIRPPIVFTKENAQLAVSALDRALEGIRHGVAG
jgi:4-aminobutyrate aminotransferase-like enzyme/aminoglycoside phosphotransferase (APT) family kinase protein